MCKGHSVYIHIHNVMWRPVGGGLGLGGLLVVGDLVLGILLGGGGLGLGIPR